MRYIAEKSISFSLKIKGRDESVRVSFSSLSTGGSSYSTDSEPIIEAMEKSPMYGKFYQRAAECLEENARSYKRATKQTQRKKNIVVDSVETWQDALEYLTENLGLAGEKLSTPDDILREAEEKGVSFPKLS